jgi:dTDP-4-amino-4,6-dideoxygalactose transaminase
MKRSGNQSFSSWPYYGPDEIAAAKDVLESCKVNYWTGEQGRLFEDEFAKSCGVTHGIALANGTVALELALRGIGIKADDEVIVTSRSFIASASCITLIGAFPVFADVDRNSQNITAESIRKVMTSKTRAIIAVHLAGWPCEMDSILEVAKEHDLKVIEDCAQAHGAKYKGRATGSFGDVSAFSFCQDKIMSTGGEGGMLLTNNDEIWEKCWSFKDHGKNYHKVQDKNHAYGFRWLHDSFGTNYRMTEMQAAIGRIQLRKLPHWVEVRRRNASIFNQGLSELQSIRLTIPPSEFYHSYYKYYAFIRPEKLRPGWNRDRILLEINKEGLPAFSGSCSEMYLEEAFTNSRFRHIGNLPTANELGETSMMFLVHPTLSEGEIIEAVEVIRGILTNASF